MIIVTGGAGFIGSNLVKRLNDKGHTDILIVDNVRNGKKFLNIVDCEFSDYMDKYEFLTKVKQKELPTTSIKAIFHQGACSSTTEWDGQYLIENNYEYSKSLLHYAMEYKTPFIYASSAAIYGANTINQENPRYEKPFNAYGASKLLFDRYVRRYFDKATSQIVGLRYFNVYGPNEAHKTTQKSLIQQFYDELIEKGTITIFDGIQNCNSGDQKRDFVYISDVVNVITWSFENPSKNGIFNLGSGRSESFEQIAQQIIDYCGHGEIRYAPIPQHLRDSYQVFSEADLTLLRALGYSQSFKPICEAIREYLPADLPN